MNWNLNTSLTSCKEKKWFQDTFIDQVAPDRPNLVILLLELFESQVYQSAPLANVRAIPTEKLHTRTAEQMVLRSIMDTYIPFTIQGMFVFKVYISKQQKIQYDFALICLYRNLKHGSYCLDGDALLTKSLHCIWTASVLVFQTQKF